MNNFIKSIILVCVCVLVSTGCQRQIQKREYEEYVSVPQFDPHAGHDHKHDHDRDHDGLPEGHPEISGDQSMVPPDMQVPSGAQGVQVQRALDASVTRPPLSWITPEGWTEKKGGGMRLATFTANGTGGSVECSIISLGGQAGGLESNVARWMRQIKVSVPPASQFKAFLERQTRVKTKGGFTITLIDLTEFTPDESSSSMIGGIGDLPNMKVFIKMTGSKAAVIQQRKALQSLCQSLNLE